MPSGFNVGAGNGSLGLMHEIAKPENRSWVNIISIAVQSTERELGYFISATALSWPSLVSVENAWGEVFEVYSSLSTIAMIDAIRQVAQLYSIRLFN